MSGISAQMVKSLRDKTGAGIGDCKAALEESRGDEEKAIEWLRKKGMKNVAKRGDKVAAEGVVFSYIHAGGRIGVMLELNSESDFVARGADFQGVAKELAMHIAWANPKYVSRDEVPQDVIEREKDIYLAQLKPEQQKNADRIIPGKLEKFYEDNCLIDQYDARDQGSKKRMGDIVNDLSAKVGEKISVRRFVRFEVGEGIQVEAKNYADEVQAVLNAV